MHEGRHHVCMLQPLTGVFKVILNMGSEGEVVMVEYLSVVLSMAPIVVPWRDLILNIQIQAAVENN